jgi:predicted DNA repair protein MutK
MAGASLLALLDDIATVLDDVALMTKMAAKKTAGVLGDDLALNAQQVSGVRAERELPVVWAVAKGSLLNKAMLVPAALLISVVAPWAITPLLMLGGAYLCFEGFEKITHKWLSIDSRGPDHGQVLAEALSDPSVDFREIEAEKIKGAIRTDFILSAEIIVITLGTVAGAAMGTQIVVLTGIALLMTIGVYGVVAGIVKLDDAGLWLSARNGGVQRWLGRAILAAAPLFMKALSVIGTAAMFLVGGGILVHGLPWLGRKVHGLEHRAETIPAVGDIVAGLAPVLLNGLIGIAAGALLVLASKLARRLFGGSSARGH